MRVVADKVPARGVAVRLRHREVTGLVNNVTVGQHEPVWGEDDARAASAFALDPYDGRADCLDHVNDCR